MWVGRSVGWGLPGRQTDPPPRRAPRDCSGPRNDSTGRTVTQGVPLQSICNGEGGGGGGLLVCHQRPCAAVIRAFPKDSPDCESAWATVNCIAYGV